MATLLRLTEERSAIQKTMPDFAQQKTKPLVSELDQSLKGEVTWDLIKEACETGIFSRDKRLYYLRRAFCR